MKFVTKSEVILTLAQQFDDKIKVLKSALAEASESANGDETKSEGKYDTRAVEASYLAQAQDQQINQMKEDAEIFRNFEPPEYTISDQISLGALVETNDAGEIRFYYLAPSGGGFVTQFLGCELTVITPESRLYQALLEKKMGDTLEEPPLMITGIE